MDGTAAKGELVGGATREVDACAVAGVDVFDYFDGILRDAEVPPT